MSDEQTTDTPSEESEPKRIRTPEEIQAMREAMMAKRAARAAGLDEPPDPPAAAAKVEAPQTQAPAPTQAEAAAPVEDTPPAKAEDAPKERPESPGRKRTPEEILAQREAMLARRAAKAAGVLQEPAKAQAEAPAAKTAAPAAKPAAAAKKAPAKKPAAKAKPAAKGFEQPQNVSRREFLNLAWLSSLALLTVQTLGVSVLFLFPRFKEGQFGGLFSIGRADSVLPELNAPPKAFNDGKFWLTNTDNGVYAIYKVCTHLGCLYAWADVTSRFECPCHGSKFSLTGKYIAGPAPRSLDRFEIIATRPDGTEIITPPDGAGIQLNGDEELTIDTGKRIFLPGRVEV
jgi:cytochrome b6-f complex iron-sulfur subunit